jgi:hypothetical protein
MKTWHYYAIAAIALLFLNFVLTLLGFPRVGWVWIIFFALVARSVQQWWSQPTGEDLVKQARELDQSWTDADNQTFKELLRKQNQ